MAAKPIERLFKRHVDRITGRRWVTICGTLHFGFGPMEWLERIQWRSRVLWGNRRAYLKGVLARGMAEPEDLEKVRTALRDRYGC